MCFFIAMNAVVCNDFFPILSSNTNLELRNHLSEQKAFVEICISVTANVSKLKACVRPHVNVRPEPSFPFSRALFFRTKKKQTYALGFITRIKNECKNP